MHVLFIIDPLPSLSAYKDSSVAMMRALNSRGHTLSIALQEDVYIKDGVVKAWSTPIACQSLTDLHAKDWWAETGPSTEWPLDHFSAVLMRKDPPFDMEYFYSTHLLGHAQNLGACVFNDPVALRNHSEKLAIMEFPDLVAPMMVTRSMVRIKEFCQEQQDIIVKPLDAMGGKGVFRLQIGDANLNAILETLTLNGTQTIMAQRYLPEISQGDKRILLINGQAVPYALARIPTAGETRANLAAGGLGIAQPSSARDNEIVKAIGPRLAARGLLLVGLDVIGDFITEINVTSPTCFVEITEQTGFDVAQMFVQALETQVLVFTKESLQ